MKTRIELDQEDIIGIIADHFNVMPEDVLITMENVVAGYGPMEYTEQKVKVVVCSQKRCWGW